MKKTGRQKLYEKRTKWIKHLYFKDYKEYLASNTWKRLKGEVLAKRSKCVICGGKGTQLHHNRYTLPVLMGEGKYWMGGLVLLCNICHEKVYLLAKEKNIHEEYAYRIIISELKSRQQTK